MMKRKNKFPLKPLLLIALVVLVGVMVFNSGVLEDIGLLKGNIPDDIGIVENDPRVIPKEEGDLNKEGVQKTLDMVVSWITGKVPQGEAKIISTDVSKRFLLSGFKYEIRDAVTDVLIQTLETGVDGTAKSVPLNYRKAYKVVQIQTPAPYVVQETEIVFEMKAPTIELQIGRAHV
mgnify:CR=1 FL=1